MAIKEKVKKFYKKHRTGIILASGGITLAGATLFGIHKLKQNNQLIQSTLETTKNSAIDEVANRTAWNKDWNAIGNALEFVTHQPLGPFGGDDDNSVDPLEGNTFILAGYNSFYNDSPDKVAIYCVDKDGWYHLMPDEAYTNA